MIVSSYAGTHSKSQNNPKLKTVLVVDDDYAILESLKLILEEFDYKVITSADGRILDNHLNIKSVDVILMDYLLPLKNGTEITKKLKSDPKTSNIPVIIISASYNIKKIVHDAGADDFIPKPYDINTLLDKIGTYSGR